MHQTTLRTVIIATALACATTGAQAQQVTLRASIETSGPAVTLGDLFTNAGPVSGRAVTPAPGAGRTANLPARFVQAAASAAGLEWTAPEGLSAITVTGRGGRGGGVETAAATTASPSARFERTAAPSGDVAVRRGEMVTLVYVAPGMQLTTRARATADAAIGDPVRVVNLQSNRTVDATVTGVGAASASASN